MEEYEAWQAWVEANFIVSTGSHYTVTAETIAATKSSVTSIAYNDAYYNASSVSKLQAAFEQMVTTIQQKAMSAPTRVTSGDHDFDGYVTFTDPLGEYMEVKDIKGIVAGGYFYRGQSFAQNLASGTDAEFNDLLVKVLQTRTNMTASSVNVSDLLAKAKASPNQAYYNNASDYDNSIVWWGKSYNSGEEDVQVQMLGFADNDTIEYITDENTSIPAGADYVCRSYFFYGEAGGTNPNPDHEYLYFMVRVQRELVAPYRETVVISAPASLLSMEKVLVTESIDDDGNLSYTAAVEHQEPARVVYEVGLWDTINSENVASMVSAEYANETVTGGGSVNYDAEKGVYNFFTNDWDRTESLGSHHRAQAMATFDAAADNEFYTYQEDTLVVDASGNAVTANPAGATAYYVREYFEWSDGGVDGTYTATKKTTLIEVDIPAGTQLINTDGKWYIPKGTYTAATLIVNGDDTTKSENKTGTSSVVAHPHRTGDSTNSHYTVLLGNNGMLTLKSDPYIPTKTVSIGQGENATQIVDDEGNPVKVGDVLTYTVEVKNTLDTPATLTVTDYVPLGTAFVTGSAGVGENPTGHTKDASIVPDGNNILTWTLTEVPAGETRYVSFQVTVTEAAMSLATVSGSITNTARFAINNGAFVSSNTTTSPVFGKTVTDVNNQTINGKDDLKVGDTLVYHIRFQNTATDDTGAFVAADVIVTDKLVKGLTFVSADNGGVYDADTHTVTWTFDNMAANSSQVVSLQVQVNAAAEVVDGAISLPNTATVTVDNDPIVTNGTENEAEVGDLAITKTVSGGNTGKSFLITLSESTGMLSGSFTMLRGTAQEAVLFTNGKAAVAIKHGETLTIKALPAGAIITVVEDTSNLPGWTATYSAQTVTVREGAATTVATVDITNTYALQPLTLTLKGEKIMEGVELNQEATLGFVAVPDSANPVVGDPITGEVTVQAPGKYTFTMSPKTFTQPGVYKYTISEINGGLKGITYDQTRHELVITVTDKGDGTLGATATLNGAAFDMANGAVSFTNSYTPEDTQLELTAGKTLSGRSLSSGEFNFLLTDGTNSYKGINDADGNIVFETITYNAEGTYTYTMSEVVPTEGAKGITYDTRTYTVQVVVTDVNGQLTTAVSVENKAITVNNGVADTGVVFTNSYTPDDVPLTLVASKALWIYNGAGYTKANPAADSFTFHVTSKASGNVIATGKNDANGNIVFNTIYFSDAQLDGAKTKDFVFVISEVVPTVGADPDMLYDSTKHEVTATLTKNADGTLSVSVGGDSDGRVDTGISFSNYQNPDSVEVSPTGTKTTSDAPDGVSFSFTVVNTATGNEVAAGVGAANGSISFSELSFSEPGTYTYWIYESNAGNTTNGITYDASRYLMKVVVSRNNYNRLVAEVTYWSSSNDGSQNVADYTTAVNAPSFHNEYHAGGFINLTARKQLSGRTLKANEFAFKLIRQDNGGEIDGLVAADGTVTFSTMYYSGADIPAGQTSSVIHYVMSEVVPPTAALPGITYDETKHDVYVRITDQGNGQISAELVKPEGDGYVAVEGSDTGVVFRNTYAATQGDTVTYQIRKDLVGRDLRAGEFEFGLYLNGKLEDVATNDENGIVTFTRTIPATAAQYSGMYEMVIKEETGSSAGITYSTQEYKIYVKVVDDGHGKIHATVHLSADGPALAEDANGVVDLTDRFVFNNSYEAPETSYAPVITKELTGRPMVAGEFTFQALLVSENGTAVTGGKTYTGINAADGKVVFESLKFTEAGTYIYRLTEIKGSHTGMQYDATTYYLKVEVTDDGNGHLKVAAGYYSDADCGHKVNAVVFKNTYTPADATIQLEGTKQLTGRKLNDKEFSFVVRENDATGDIVATGSNDASGKILFSSFDITAEDMAGAASKTFQYVVMESDNNIPGVTTDKTVFEVSVTVTDDGTGRLTASVSYGEAVVFKNTYTPAATELPLVAFKTLVGKDLAANEYTFLLKQGSETKQTVKNDQRGVVRFESLKFTEAGTYTYTVSEQDGGDKRVAYDKAVYTVTVKVTDDGNGNLVATASYSNGSETVDVLSFTNTFTPTAVEVELEGTKLITDAKGEALDLDEGGFEFEVRDVRGNLLTTATSDAEGNIKITGLSFSAAGEYRLLVTEKATEKPGFSIDPTMWCVHITIAYDSAKGILSETGEYIHIAPESHDTVALAESQELTFTNVYAPAGVELMLKVSKLLEGRPLRDHDFTFRMTDNATGFVVAETRNHADGTVPFHLTFSQPGEFTYTISEVKEGKTGITYSDETYQVTVKVTDDGTGALKAQVGTITTVGSGSVDMSASVVFHNTYKAQPTELTISGRKVMTGRDLAPGEFEFVLLETNADFTTAKEGGTTETVKNDANGAITFTAIDYTTVGEHYYVVSEVIPEEPAEGITYDKTVYLVTVKVIDDGNGSLVASEDILIKGASTTDVAEILFHNSFIYVPKVHVTLPVKKVMTGDKTDPTGFTFGLYETQGATEAVQSVTSDADGLVEFSQLTFKEAGTYTYYVREQLPVEDGKTVTKKDNVTYDTTEYRVDIIVTAGADGELTATWTVDGEAVSEDYRLTFTNSYKKPAASTPQTGDEMDLVLWSVLLLVSMLGMVALPVLRKRK